MIPLLRLLVVLVLAMLLAPLLVPLLRGVVRLVLGLTGGPADGTRRGSGPPADGVRMARDPVCGTFVAPGRALTTSAGGKVHYFCSEDCRRAWLAGDRGGRISAR